jgi:hypothetical protein
MTRVKSLLRLLSWCVTGILAVAAPAAAADLGWHGLEVRGGATFPADWDTGWTVAASADLGEIVDGLRLYPGISYAKAETSESFNLFGVPFGVDQEITTLALGAEVRWFFAGEPRGWYVGGGPYFHRLEYEVAAIVGNAVGKTTVESDSLGIEGVAGYSFGGRFNVEARYDTVSNFKGAQLLVGIRFGG